MNALLWRAGNSLCVNNTVIDGQYEGFLVFNCFVVIK